MSPELRIIRYRKSRYGQADTQFKNYIAICDMMPVNDYNTIEFIIQSAMYKNNVECLKLIKKYNMRCDLERKQNDKATHLVGLAHTTEPDT